VSSPIDPPQTRRETPPQAVIDPHGAAHTEFERRRSITAARYYGITTEARARRGEAWLVALAKSYGRGQSGLGVVYPGSDKVGVRPPGGGPDRLNFRRGEAVDYWDGE
jgi:hypothetical protein